MGGRKLNFEIGAEELDERCDVCAVFGTSGNNDHAALRFS